MEKYRKYMGWATILIVWSFVSYSGIFPWFLKLVIAKPHQVVVSFFTLLFGIDKQDAGAFFRQPYRDIVWMHVWHTIRRTVVGLSIASLWGIPLGVIIGSFRGIREAAEPVLNFFRSIPSTAFFSIFMLLFGIKDGSKISMVAFGCGLMLTVGAMEGIVNAEKETVEAARLDGADEWQLIRYVTWYLALPHIYANFRVALGVAFILTNVAEQTAGNNGLGNVISAARWAYAVPEALAAIIILGLLGQGAQRLLQSFRPKILHWLE